MHTSYLYLYIYLSVIMPTQSHFLNGNGRRKWVVLMLLIHVSSNISWASVCLVGFDIELNKTNRFYQPSFPLHWFLVLKNAIFTNMFSILLWISSIARRWASSFCHHISTVLGLKWELRGKEHLEKDQACIIVANHQSSLDILGKS